MHMNTATLRLTSTRMATQRAGTLAAVALAVLMLPGCGGGNDDSAAEARADELLVAEPMAAAIPDAIADQLIAEELAGSTAQKAGLQTVAKNGSHDASERGYCLPRANPVYAWNQLALEAVRLALPADPVTPAAAPKFMNDVQSARLYAMVNVAMYDAVNGIEARRGSRRATALVGADGAPRDASLSAAAAAAAHAVLVALRPDQKAAYDTQLETDLAALRHRSTMQAGAAWGARVGQQVVLARQADGSADADPVLAVVATPPAGQFTASWGSKQFRNLKPFAIASAARYVPLPTAKPALNSPEYAAAYNEVRVVGRDQSADPGYDITLDTNLATYKFWASSAGTSQPPGEWVKVALTLTRKKNLSIQDSARLMALMGIGLSDAVAPTISTKYSFNHWRPKTAINRGAEDGNPATEAGPAWKPRGGSVGTTPEYVSGHSVFAGVGSTILRGYFCNDNLPFSLQTDGAPAARTYSTFSSAATESGRSRVMGGVHFEFSNRDGLAMGQGVATEVLGSALLRTHGETHQHRGACPL